MLKADEQLFHYGNFIRSNLLPRKRKKYSNVPLVWIAMLFGAESAVTSRPMNNYFIMGILFAPTCFFLEKEKIFKCAFSVKVPYECWTLISRSKLTTNSVFSYFSGFFQTIVENGNLEKDDWYGRRVNYESLILFGSTRKKKRKVNGCFFATLNSLVTVLLGVQLGNFWACASFCLEAVPKLWLLDINNLERQKLQQKTPGRKWPWNFGCILRHSFWWRAGHRLSAGHPSWRRWKSQVRLGLPHVFQSPLIWDYLGSYQRN